MQEKLIITNRNESYVRIQCSDSVAWELRDAFAYRPPGFQFVPSYRNKLWDGWLRMFNLNTREMLRGLVPAVQQWASERGYECEYPDEEPDENISLIEAQEYVETLKPDPTPRDYQLDGFVHAIRSKRKIIISPTGSGKSLLQYMLFNYLAKKGLRGILIVPRASLVEQMYSDFVDYSKNNGKDMSKYCHKVYQGKSKDADVPLIISTWQSLQNLPPVYFKKFDYVIVDEVHTASLNTKDMKVLNKIVSYMTNAKYRIGVTGTLPDEPHVKLSLTGLIGEAYKVVSSAELMERKQLAELSIKCIVLQYSSEECQLMKSASYQQEIDYIVGNKARNTFISNLALSLNGNTLILYNYVEKHGKVLYNELCQKVKDGRKVFFIHGGTDVEEREQIRKIVETETNAIIVGSSGCLSTGTNIVNLSTVIFASPNKSRIRTLQSIGRVLRRSNDKTNATLFDISDDFTYKKHVNYTMKHFLERMKMYVEEKFVFKIYKVGVGR